MTQHTNDLLTVYNGNVSDVFCFEKFFSQLHVVIQVQSNDIASHYFAYWCALFHNYNV